MSGPTTPTGSQHFRPGNYLNADDVCLLITEYSAPYSAVQIANEHDRIVRGLVKELDALRATTDAQAERVRMLVDALHEVGIGGNHAALLIGADHPPYTATKAEAETHYGNNLDALNAWFCWRAIMKAMRETYDTLPEDIRAAAWKRMDERRARAALNAGGAA